MAWQTGEKQSMSTSIVLPGSRKIWLEVVKGVVLDASESQVSVVSQGRDGRQFIDGVMIVRPGRIYSEIVSVHKVLIREADGHESGFDLSEFPVDARTGHTLSIIYGAAEGVQEGVIFGALNVSTGKHNFDKSVHCDRLRPFGLYLSPKFYRKRMLWGTILGAAAGLTAMFAGGDSSFLVGGAILGFVFSLPVALVNAVIVQVRGMRLVPELNKRALEVLLSKTHSVNNAQPSI